MLTVDRAHTTILELVQPLDPQIDRETVSLLAAAGRILATPVISPLDFPHWDNSAMDGYAVRYADVQLASPDRPVQLTIVATIPAGSPPQATLQPGQAARIFTGSMLPPGADTIVIQEHTQRQGDTVTVLQAPQPQAFVRHQGSFHRAGEPLFPAGIRLQAAAIAVLAAAQYSQVPVYRRPRVALLSTGNELVPPDHPLQPGQLVDSNQYALATLVQNLGTEPIPLGIVPDRPKALQTAIAQAITQADVVVSSGGVSVGDYDYVAQSLTALGGRIVINAVAIKPGKPLTVATFPPHEAGRSCLYFGLPGNPVSALVTCWRFMQPALNKLAGLASDWGPAWVWANTHQDLPVDNRRESYLWGRLTPQASGYGFALVAGGHSSGNLINLAHANALAIVPVGTAIAAGNPVQVMPLHR
ncbi:molybdopterin molybdotransferase MoeA [Trichothermofontia sp.]